MPPSTRGAAVASAVALLCAALVALSPAPATAAARTAGTLTITGEAPDGCPAGGYTCSTFRVTCAAPYADVPAIDGRMAVGAHLGTRLKGIVMLFVGNDGMEYWGGTPERRAFVDDLHVRGYRTVEVAWDEPYAHGTQGYVALTCRPAAAVEWGAGAYAASGAQPVAGDGVCGFCLIGTSAGTAQVAYPLVFHGLGGLVDAALEMSGPAESDLYEACDRSTPVSPFQFLEVGRSPARARIDGAWDGGAATAGPCESNPFDPSFAPAWAANSLAAGSPSAVHAFPTTRWHFIWGAKDTTGAAGQGQLFLRALDEAGSPMLGHDCMNGPHDLASNAKALRQLRAAVEWKPSDGPDHPPPLGEPVVDPRCELTRG
ncbi:MAG TPA: hypothetical protein VGB14_15625 [Acidimicrobiales bacterium]|jgi:hypothetical protein